MTKLPPCTTLGFEFVDAGSCEVTHVEKTIGFSHVEWVNKLNQPALSLDPSVVEDDWLFGYSQVTTKDFSFQVNFTGLTNGCLVGFWKGTPVEDIETILSSDTSVSYSSHGILRNRGVEPKRVTRFPNDGCLVTINGTTQSEGKVMIEFVISSETGISQTVKCSTSMDGDDYLIVMAREPSTSFMVLNT